MKVRPSKNLSKTVSTAQLNPSFQMKNLKEEDLFESRPPGGDDSHQSNPHLQSVSWGSNGERENRSDLVRSPPSMKNEYLGEAQFNFFSKMQSEMCRYSRPLVLLSSDKQETELLDATKFITDLPSNHDWKEILKQKKIVIFDAKTYPRGHAIDPQWFLQSSGKHTEYLAMMRMNSGRDYMESFTEQFKFAAMLAAGVLGFDGTKLAADMLDGIPEDKRQAAIDQSIFYLEDGEGLPVLRQLLEWGANPDALRDDDEMTPLISAIRSHRIDEIKLLVARGASISEELGACCSALDEVTENSEFNYLLKYLQP